MRDVSYAAPSSVDEAIGLLVKYGRRARVLAGGTDLIVQLREGLRDCDLLIDVKRIPELMEVRVDESGALTLGASVPCTTICRAPAIRRAAPGLLDAASIIGGIAVQARASIGGNLCNSGPAADSIPMLIAYAARCHIAGPTGRRATQVEEFCTAPGQNVLADDELLVSIDFPALEPHSGGAYMRFIPRGEMDIAVSAAAAYVALDGDTITSARIGVGAVAPTPLFVPGAGAAIVGRRTSDETYALAVAEAQEVARPITDMRGTSEHRRSLVAALVARVLRRAVARAQSPTLS